MFTIWHSGFYYIWIIPLALSNFVLNQFLDQFEFLLLLSSMTFLCRNGLILFLLSRTHWCVFSSRKSLTTSSKGLSPLWVSPIPLIILYLTPSTSRLRILLWKGKLSLLIFPDTQYLSNCLIKFKFYQHLNQ